MRFGEAVERERGDRLHDLILVRAGDAARRHAGAQPRFDRLHALRRALEAHRAPQLLGLAAGEAGRGHRDAQELLLEERDAEGAFQDRLEAGVEVGHRLASPPALEERVHHAAGDRSRADDGDLDDEIVEAGRRVARQGGHLRAALDLEDADRVGGAQHGVDLRVVGRQVGEIDIRPLVVADDRNRLFERVQHAESEKIDLDDPEVGAVVLVPLHDRPAGHRRRFERHHLVEPAGGDHHAARVLPEVPRQVLDLPPVEAEQAVSRLVRVEAGGRELALELLGVAALEVVAEVAELLGELCLPARASSRAPWPPRVPPNGRGK